MLTGALVMAPMTKGSNLPYRRLCTELGARVLVSEMVVARRLKQRRAATGETAPRRQRHGRVPVWVTHAEAIREAVRQAPDATLDEYRQRFRLPVSRATLARALVVLGLTRKKSPSGRASRTAPT